jgi:hypothetical protein
MLIRWAPLALRAVPPSGSEPSFGRPGGGLMAEPLVKLVLQIDHVGTRIEASLGVHPVIRRDHEHRP